MEDEYLKLATEHHVETNVLAFGGVARALRTAPCSFVWGVLVAEAMQTCDRLGNRQMTRSYRVMEIFTSENASRSAISSAFSKPCRRPRYPPHAKDVATS